MGNNGSMDPKPTPKCWYMPWSSPPTHSSKFLFSKQQLFKNTLCDCGIIVISLRSNQDVVKHNKLFFRVYQNQMNCSSSTPVSAKNFLKRWLDLWICFAFKSGEGVQAFQFLKHDFELWVGVMAWTCTHNLRVVLGPCAQYYPSEASEQKWVKNRKLKNMW